VLVIGGVLGVLLLSGGAALLIQYAGGSALRSAYDGAPVCAAAGDDHACRRLAPARITDVRSRIIREQNARAARLAVYGWDVTVDVAGVRRTAHMASTPSGLFTGAQVTVETWRGSITSINLDSTAYPTTDSPEAYGEAPLAIGGVLAAAGLTVAGAAGVAVARRRSGRVARTRLPGSRRG
jgi:hypothetical protein